MRLLKIKDWSLGCLMLTLMAVLVMLPDAI